jgi:hypothetical protein
VTRPGSRTKEWKSSFLSRSCQTRVFPGCLCVTLIDCFQSLTHFFLENQDTGVSGGYDGGWVDHLPTAPGLLSGWGNFPGIWGAAGGLPRAPSLVHHSTFAPRLAWVPGDAPRWIGGFWAPQPPRTWLRPCSPPPVPQPSATPPRVPVCPSAGNSCPGRRGLCPFQEREETWPRRSWGLRQPGRRALCWGKHGSVPRSP